MNLKRNIESFLSSWVASKDNEFLSKPLIVEGQRQVGKTTTIKNYFYKNNIPFTYIDLSKEINLYDEIKSFDINRLLNILSADYNFNLNSPYIFFDEAQHCLHLIQMLKYFRELKPEIRIIVSGSLLSLKLFENKEKIMYPTGKVNIIKLCPLSFEEFVINVYPEINNKIVDSLMKVEIDEINIYKRKMLNIYYEYLLVGGMPEPVVYYIESMQSNYVDRFKKSSDEIYSIKRNYLEDIRNHFENTIEKQKSETIFNGLHLQMNKENKRFMVSEIKLENKDNTNNRLRDFKIPIYKLLTSRMIGSIKYLTQLKEPFNNFVDESKFKLYYSDIAFYTYSYKLTIDSMIANSDIWNFIKGGVTENFVFNELINNYYINLDGTIDLYTFAKNNKNEKLEIDFLLYEKYLPPLVIEVKSSTNTKSISFNKIKNEHQNWNYIKLSLNNLAINDQFINIPVYLIGYFYKHIIMSNDKEIYKKYGLKLNKWA